MPRSIKLLVGQTAAVQDAVLEDDLPSTALEEIEAQWGHSRQEGIRRLAAAGAGALGQHGHWAWNNDRKRAGVGRGRYRLMGVRVGSEWQGAMTIDRRPHAGRPWTRWGRIVQYLIPNRGERNVVYVDYVETAPWNFEPFARPDPPRYRGVGGHLLAEAVTLSFDLGLAGRVGLFSLPGAEPFYRRIGMTRLFDDRNPGSQTYGCGYYEFDAAAAEQYLERQAARPKGNR